jgi:lysophospholipase
VRRIASIIFLLLAGLCACKPVEDPRAPFTDSRIPPGLQHRFYPPQGWAWGLIRIGKAPPVRYGVAAPATVPRGQIIILPAYGETAEAWFGTARDLIAQGYVVWVLEGSGQGGSGRRSLPRDLVDAASLDPDVTAVAALAVQLSRERPRYLLGAGTSTPVAVRAAALGVPLDGLILLRPRFGPYSDPAGPRTSGPSSFDVWLHRLSIGRLRAQGGHGWQTEFGGQRSSETASRQYLAHQWQRANPDLRMGDPSADWVLAYRAQLQAAAAAWPQVRVPTLLIGQDLCARRPSCRHEPEEAVGRQRDPHAALIDQVLRFIDPNRGGLARAPAAATVEPES